MDKMERLFAIAAGIVAVCLVTMVASLSLYVVLILWQEIQGMS